MFTFEIAQLAQKSLLYEASAYPKPGLVTPLDNGAHHDMDYRMFLDSSVALLPCFINCVSIGMETHDIAPIDVLGYLREAGKQGEKEMYRATMGINTHKGAIFLIGLLCAATGRLKGWEASFPPARVAFTASLFVEGIVERELASLSLTTTSTAGERAYLAFGLDGARGEAERAFPTVLSALKELEKLSFESLSFNDRLAHVLLFIMTQNSDNNLIRRGGKEGMLFVQGLARKALEEGGMCSPEGRKQVAVMERALVEHNLSPGGSADILSAALFLKMLRDGEDRSELREYKKQL